jgi:pimeloyl-ACP methyl ester carboxylesterase
MGSAIAQELALRHPELVRSLVLVSTYARPDALWRSQLNFWRWLPEVAPSGRAFFEGFVTWQSGAMLPERGRTGALRRPQGARWRREARLITAVGIDDGGQVLDDEESRDQPVVEVEHGGSL